MDGVSAAANIIALATALKDIVELEEKVRESFGKVKKNRDSLLFLSVGLSRTIDLLLSLIKRQSQIFNLPSFQEPLQNLYNDLEVIYVRCKKIWTKHSGLEGKISYFRAWRKASKIEEEIKSLEKQVNQCHERFMIEATSEILYNTAEQASHSGSGGTSKESPNEAYRDEKLYQDLIGVRQRDQPTLREGFRRASERVPRQDLNRVHIYLELKVKEILKGNNQKLITNAGDGVRLELILSRPPTSTPQSSITEGNHMDDLGVSTRLNRVAATSSSHLEEPTTTADPDEVRALHRQALELLRYGYSSEALTVMEEVIIQFSSIPNRDSESFTLFDDEIEYKNTFACCLRALGREQDALEKFSELVQILHSFAMQYPKELDRHLARALVYRAGCLHALGRNMEALQCALDALELLRNSQEGTSPLDPSTARTLLRIGFIYSDPDMGAYGDALKYFAAAVDEVRILSNNDPGSYSAELASYLCHLSQCCSRIRQPQISSDLSKEALIVYKRFVYQYTDEEKQLIIDKLMNHSSVFLECGNFDAAISFNKLAVDLRRNFTELGSESRDPAFALTLRHLSWCLFEAGKKDVPEEKRNEALDFIKEAINVHEYLKGKHSEKYEKELAWDVAFLVRILCGMKEHSRALVPAKKATDIYRRHAQFNPSLENKKALVCALENLQECYTALEKPEEKRHVEQEIRSIKRDIMWHRHK